VRITYESAGARENPTEVMHTFEVPVGRIVSNVNGPVWPVLGIG